MGAKIKHGGEIAMDINKSREWPMLTNSDFTILPVNPNKLSRECGFNF